MKVTGNGVQKELKFNLQHNAILFKTYKILSGKLTTCFYFANKVFPSPPQLTLLAEGRKICNITVHTILILQCQYIKFRYDNVLSVG